MKKKFLITFLTIALSISGINISYTDVKAAKFNDSTIVTEKNIIQILDYLNVPHGELVKSKTASLSKNYTVKDLKKSLRKISNKASITTSGESSVSLTDSNYISIDAAKKKHNYINKTYSRSQAHDGYDLDYYVHVKYDKTAKKFVETTGQGVGIDSELVPIIYKISKKSCSSSCTSTKITLKANVTVKYYVGIGKFGLVAIGSQNVKSTQYWYLK